MSELEKADLVIEKNNFFTKKRITIVFFAAILAIAFLMTISILFLELDINSINNFFIQGFTQPNNMFFLSLILMFAFPLYTSLLRYIVIYIRIRRQNCSAIWYDWIFLIFIGSFLNAITQVGGQAVLGRQFHHTTPWLTGWHCLGCHLF